METAQSQLLTLLLLQYRDRLPGAQKAAYDILQQFRPDLTREELEHIRDRIQETNEALHRTRVSKASNLCREAGLEWTRNRAAQLSTTSHHRNCLFNGTDLPNRVTTRAIGQDNLEVERRPENVNVEEEVPATVQRVEEDENGRLVGRFVSGSVVNLSRRELSEEDVSLLSKGLKFSPTPTDIDKAKLNEDLEAYKRRMRLKWHFRNNEEEFVPDENANFRPKSTWQPPKDDPVLENYLSLLEKEVMSVSPEGKNFSNLSSSEQLSLKQLKSDRNIVIKEADKG